jgi:fructokinase
MPRVYAVGETVLDIIFRDNKPQAARAGGAMLNSLVSLGRLGVEVFFISEYGPDIDPVGNIIHEFLAENHVNTDFVHRPENLKSPLALAFLNESRDASYSFYRTPPKECMPVPDISFEEGDVFLFGSFYALNPQVRPLILALLSRARDAGAIIVYDPNFRKPHLHELPMLKPFILENLTYAHIIRGSDEDFSHIFNSGSVDEAFRAVDRESELTLIYTQNRKGVDLISPDSRIHLDVPFLEPVSTIGAGDSFNAGIIWSLLRERITKKDIITLSDKQWKNILNYGIRFASDVCMSYENYISAEFAERLKV